MKIFSNLRKLTEVTISMAHRYLLPTCNVYSSITIMENMRLEVYVLNCENLELHFSFKKVSIQKKQEQLLNYVFSKYLLKNLQTLL